MNLGCIKSKIDGTEYLFKEKDFDIPEIYSYEKALPEVLNQKDSSICVPCSISTFLNWDCNLNSGVNNTDNQIDLLEIYNSRQDKIPGMQIKEALSYLKNHGVNSKKGVLKINKYAKINSEQALKYALIANGPCIGALPVYDFDKNEFWKDSSKFEGYHAVAIIGYNTKGFIIRNSWGTNFGKNGNTILPYEDFNNLLELWTIIN